MVWNQAANEIVYLKTPASIRVGSETNTAPLTIGGTHQAVGNIEMLGGSATLNTSAQLRSLGTAEPSANSGQILVRSNNAAVALSASSKLLTKSGPIILWAAGGQNISISNQVEISTTQEASAGAPIYIGGGAAETINGVTVPSGFASGGTHGVLIGGSLTSNSTLTSGEGDIRIRGGAGTVSGVTLFGAGTTLSSTTGDISLEASAPLTSTAEGVSIQQAAIQSVDGKISIRGELLNPATSAAAVTLTASARVETTGAATDPDSDSPDISIYGKSARAGGAGVTLQGAARVLSVAGDIDVEADGGTTIAISDSGTQFGAAGTDPTTSTSNIRFAGGAINGTAGVVRTSGSLVVEPFETQNYSSAATWNLTGSGFSSARFGVAGTNQTQTQSGLSIAGPQSAVGAIDIYSGTVTQGAAGTLTTTGASAPISVYAISDYSSAAALTTADSDVRIRANRLTYTGSAVNAGTGAIEVASTSAGRPIRLGSDANKAAANTANDSLFISDTEVTKLNGQFLRIGAANAGPITIETPITRTTAGSNTLKLVSAGVVSNESGAGPTVSPVNVTNLAVQAGGSIKLSSDSTATDNKLALSSLSVTPGAVQYSQLDGEFTPESVDGVDAVYGIAAGVRASDVPTTTPVSVYQNSTLNPTPKVSVVDAYGQVLYANNTLSSSYEVSIAAETLGGTLTKPLASGAAEFTDLQFAGTGEAIRATFTLAATNSAPISGEPSTITGAYKVLQSTPSGLAVNWPASVTKNGTVFPSNGPSVSLKDAGNNTITVAPYATATITATISGPGGEILEGATEEAVNGVATFSDLRIAGRVGTNYTVTFSVTVTQDQVTSEITASKTGVQVTPGDPHSMAITTQPTAVVAGVGFSPAPVVEVYDQWGNIPPSALSRFVLT
jgi:hypothetical protein